MPETWSIATDEEEAAIRRQGAIDGRFQVCHLTDGLIEWCDTLAQAFAAAERWDERDHGYPKYEVEVYDRMARRGGPRIWRRQPKKGTYCMEHGDKFYGDSRFKVIARRGAEPIGTDLTSRLWA